MGLEIPGYLRTVASVAVGKDWPEADETALRRLADAWDIAAVQIDRVGADGAKALTPALDAVSGVVNDAVAGKWDEVAGSVDDLAAACRQLAEACDTTAADVEHAKLSIIAALALLALQIASLVASATVTAGASTAMIPAAQLATQAGVRMILQQLLTKVGRAVLLDSGISGVIQVGQMVDGNRERFDWGIAANDAAGAAVSALTADRLAASPLARMYADGVSETLGRQVGDGVTGLVTGAIGAHAGNVAQLPPPAAPEPPSETPPERPQAGASSLNMNY